jgi:hypothetical protein
MIRYKLHTPPVTTLTTPQVLPTFAMRPEAWHLGILLYQGEHLASQNSELIIKYAIQ